MEVASTKLDKATHDRLLAKCNGQGCSRSQYIKRLVVNDLNNNLASQSGIQEGKPSVQNDKVISKARVFITSNGGRPISQQKHDESTCPTCQKKNELIKQLETQVSAAPTETDLKRARNEGALSLIRELGWKQYRCKNGNCGQQYHDVPGTNEDAKYVPCPECELHSPLSQGENCVFCGAELPKE